MYEHLTKGIFSAPMYIDLELLGAVLLRIYYKFHEHYYVGDNVK